MRLVGHRGAAGLAPENTLASIDAALAAGADGVEVDVRLTVDGVLVLMHDPDLGRTTDGGGLVGATTFEEVRRLDAGYRFSRDGRTFPARGTGLVVPALHEALDRLPPDRTLVVELKSSPWEPGYDPGEPVAGALGRALEGREGRSVTASCFNPAALARLREAVPWVRTAVLTTAGIDLDSNLEAAIAGGHQECHVPAAILDPAFVARAREAGRGVVAWTEDDPERLRTFASWGVDAVICNDPAAARRVLAPPAEGSDAPEEAPGAD